MTNNLARSTSLPTVAPVSRAERDDVVEQLHGVTVADPYRYLEDPDGERTQAFVAAQNAASAPYLAALPSAQYFRDAVTTLLTRPRASTPWERGGRYFRMDNPGAADQDRLVTGDSLADLLQHPRILLDPNELTDDGTAALTAAQVSPDGSKVAVGVSEAGSDWRTVTVLDTATGNAEPDRLQWTKFVPPTWLPDGSGFLYWRYPAPTGQEYVDETPPGELVLHRLGTDQQQDVQIWAPPEADGGAGWMVDAGFSTDGDWLMLTAAPGTDSRTTVELRRVTADPSDPFGDPVTVIGELTDAQHPIDVVGGRLLLHTEKGAPRGALIQIDLNDLTQTELVPEHSEDLLASVAPALDSLVLVWSHDTAHRVQFVDRAGSPLGELPVTGPESVVELRSRGTSAEVFVGTTSFTERLTIRRIEVTDRVAVQTIPSGADGPAAPPPATRPSATQPPAKPRPMTLRPMTLHPVTTERRRGRSADGTQVPMTVVRRADLPAGGPAPALLYGYGGFDIAMAPSFSALFAAWVQAGGVFVVANLRGGGEFGQQWHQAGMKQHKQRVFDDLYGCAEALIADGTTTAGHLAVHGRSNGGLLAGAALVQRPELWAAALPTVGVLDMLRFHRFTTGRAWTAEYGDPDDAADFPALYAYSPLHNLHEGTAYPPTLICTGDHDDRVVPAHSLKFGAELQRCQSGAAPVLLRVDTRAGHGMGKPVSSLAAEYADQLSFAAAHTGLTPTP